MRLVDLDAEAGGVADRIDGAVEARLHGEEFGVVEADMLLSAGEARVSSQEKFGTAAAKWTVAAVQIGPSGLCGIMST